MAPRAVNRVTILSQRKEAVSFQFELRLKRDGGEEDNGGKVAPKGELRREIGRDTHLS